MKMGNLLQNISEVRITDYTDFNPNLSGNGGKYAYTTIYSRCDYDENMWAISYETTSDFKYCDALGFFCENNCDECDNWDAYKVITTENVINAIESVAGDDNFYIEKLESED